MKRLFTSFIIGLFLMGCSTDSTTTTEKPQRMADVPVEVTVIKTGLENDVKTVAELEIEGMTCAIGCAGLIKKTVSDLNGVKLAEVNFEADSELDYAIVEYDANEISELEMAAAIQALVDGQYKVHQIKVKKYVFDENLKEEIIEKEQTTGIDVKFSFPNVFEVFTLILN